MSNPIVAPDESKIDAGVSAIVTVAAPFIPAKIRAVIYSVAGAIAVTALALSPVIGGTIGTVLGVVGAAASVVPPILALSHIGK